MTTETIVETPSFFTTKQPKSSEKVRGPNITPKQMMRVGRDWDHVTWMKAFDSYCKNETRKNYSKRNDVK